MAERLRPTVANERRRCLQLVQRYRTQIEEATRKWAAKDAMVSAKKVADRVAILLEKIEREIQDPTPAGSGSEFSIDEISKAMAIMEEMNKNPFEE